MKNKISKALKCGLIVMWNNGKDQYHKIKRVNGNNAFFEDSSIEHIDLTNVNSSEFLFLRKEEPPSSDITAFSVLVPFKEIKHDFLLQALQQPINPNAGGTANLICPTCFYREGHSLINCCKCGDKYIKFNKLNQSIPKFKWILSAIREEEKISRAGIILCQLHIEFKDENTKLLPWIDQEEHFINIAKSIERSNV